MRNREGGSEGPRIPPPGRSWCDVFVSKRAATGESFFSITILDRFFSPCRHRRIAQRRFLAGLGPRIDHAPDEAMLFIKGLVFTPIFGVFRYGFVKRVACCNPKHVGYASERRVTRTVSTERSGPYPTAWPCPCRCFAVRAPCRRCSVWKRQPVWQGQPGSAPRGGGIRAGHWPG